MTYSNSKKPIDNSTLIIKGVITADSVFNAVAKVTGISKKRIISESRLWPVAEARMISVLLFNWLGLSDIKIAWILNRNRSTVTKTRHNALYLLDYSRTFKDKLQKVRTIINNINPQQNGK